MDKEKLRHARQRLVAEQDRLKQLRNNMKDDQLSESQGNSIKELSTYDNHPGDIGSETFERGKDIALAQLVDRRLDIVGDALRAIEEGTYGICDNCGEPIAEQRLEAAPETTLCVDCRGELEQRGFGVAERPVEEDVLKPAFDRTFTDDDRDDPVGFDGEDSWQKVARYGSSNTPSDVRGSREVEDAFVDSDEQQNVVEDAEAVYEEDEDEEDGRATGRPEEPTF